ncbi:MAG: ATP cone domain-containing protein [Candidatus Shapirobacteria bacterium]|jgi:transcriptional regulator NrdR family protein|nr:ATP cone domain-containing protein [Candidatus Shapirobacteria bacterium]
MYCPFCQSDQVIVSNSRPTNKNTQIWRRRKCLKCGNIFTAREKIDISYIIVEKRDHRHVKFSYLKLYSGIYNALTIRKRADQGQSATIAEEITQKVEEILITQKIKKIKTEDIIKLVVKTLSKKYPDGALLYFAYFEKYFTINEYFHKIKLILKKTV